MKFEDLKLYEEYLVYDSVYNIKTTMMYEGQVEKFVPTKHIYKFTRIISGMPYYIDDLNKVFPTLKLKLDFLLK